MAKIRQKMKKIDFSFLVPHFSPRNEKLKKTEKREFLVLVGPILAGQRSESAANVLLPAQFLLNEFKLIYDGSMDHDSRIGFTFVLFI